MNSKIILTGLFLANILIVLSMRPSGNALIHPATPSGIINLEFAYDSTLTRNILNAWENDISADPGLPEQAKKNIYLDFIFLVLYSALLYIAAISWGMKDQRITVLMKSFSIGAGMLDLAENICMLRSLGDKISNVNSLLTAVFATLKFALIILVILYIVWSLVSKKLMQRAFRN